MLSSLVLGIGFATGERRLDGLFSPANVKRTDCDVEAGAAGATRLTLWRGYRTTGFEATHLDTSDFSGWKSLRFEVENPYQEPYSVYVRVSDQPSHPPAETYTGGTFDGFVIGPGRNSVEISLERMRSPRDQPIDPKRIAWLGVFFQPLFLRDGQDLVFAQDRTLLLSSPRLSLAPARLQKQPYGELLFRETDASVQDLRQQTERALAELGSAIEQAKSRGMETAYAEIYPYLAQIAFHSRLVAFWQDRAQEQRRALNFLLEGAHSAQRELLEALHGKASQHLVPPTPDYQGLAIRDGYFRLGDQPVLLFGMLYNSQGPLLRWFDSSETDYGTELVAGATRQNVERQPIWNAYQKFPDTHRVGWDDADHLIRDENSWEVVGPPVNICLESPHTREAIAAAIEQFEREHIRDSKHLVQNMGYEYTYACYCDYTRRMWEGWLRRKYEDIQAANRVWRTEFESFGRVGMPHPKDAASNRALWFDWSSFNLYRLLEQIRWTSEQVRRWAPGKTLTVGSPYFAFQPAFWTGMDEEELADSGITGVVLEENYEPDTLMPEYLHALAGGKPVMDFEYHGVIHQILPSFLHGDAAISMWWWNEDQHGAPNEPINEWTTNFPQSYTVPLSDLGKSMRDALDLRRLGREIAVLASAPRAVALLYSKTSMLQQLPEESGEIGTFPYLSALRRIYNASQSLGLYVGLTTEKKILSGDLEQRKVLVLPGAEFLPEAVAGAIWRWVENGGTLVVSPDSMLADEYARPADRLSKLGVHIIRREPAPLKHGDKIVTRYNEGELPRVPFIAQGMQFEAAGGRQVVECRAANVYGRFPDGAPALLRLPLGRGTAYWLTAPLEPASWQRFLAWVAERANLKPEMQISRAEGGAAREVEYRVTTFDGRRLAYLYNSSDQDLRLLLKPGFAFTSILDRRNETRLQSGRLALPARETAVLEFH